MKELRSSSVRFVEDRENDIHQYWLGFTELAGVTEVLNAVIYRDKYQGIDAEVLRNAADRGTAIHEAIQAREMGDVTLQDPDLYDIYRDDVDAALAAWNRRGGSGMTAYAAEYLVTNETDIASKVDLVYADSHGGVILADIKTTSKLDEEYVGWQLSVYKALFETMNPGIPVSGLVALWYDRYGERWQFVEVKDRGREEVDRLIAAWRAGEFWGLPAPSAADVPAPMLSLAGLYAELEAEIKTATARREEFRERLMQMMKEAGVKTFKADGITVTYKEPTQRISYDVSAFRKLHPECDADWEHCQKVSNVKESLLITVR